MGNEYCVLTIFFGIFLKTNILMTCHANTDCTQFWGTRWVKCTNWPFLNKLKGWNFFRDFISFRTFCFAERTIDGCGHHGELRTIPCSQNHVVCRIIVLQKTHPGKPIASRQYGQWIHDFHLHWQSQWKTTDTIIGLHLQRGNPSVWIGKFINRFSSWPHCCPTSKSWSHDDVILTGTPIAFTSRSWTTNRRSLRRQQVGNPSNPHGASQRTA